MPERFGWNSRKLCLRPEPRGEDGRRFRIAETDCFKALSNGRKNLARVVRKIPFSLKKIVQEVVGDLGGMGGAPAFKARHAQIVQVTAELEQQTGLANPGFPCDPHDLPHSIARTVEPLEEKPKLQLSADERSKASPAKSEAG
jgi:hypothetical protein